MSSHIANIFLAGEPLTKAAIIYESGYLAHLEFPVACLDRLLFLFFGWIFQQVSECMKDIWGISGLHLRNFLSLKIDTSGFACFLLDVKVMTIRGNIVLLLSHLLGSI